MAELSSKISSGTRQQNTNRAALYRLIEIDQCGDKLSKSVDLFLISLIIISIIAVVLESIPAFEIRYQNQLFWLEAFTVAVFTVELILRIWTSVEDRGQRQSGRSNFVIRLKFLISPYALIDIIAILPFYLVMFGIFPNVDMRFLRSIRLIRILKLTRYSTAFNMLAACCRENAQSLSAAFFVLITVMLMAASGMYFFERETQPVAFGSIPAAMWWAFATLTTVGYGDVTPMTAGGKIFGALITVIGIGMVALPTGILASGYAEQIRMRSDKYREKANDALDDGVLSEDEIDDLEKLRRDLGLGHEVASQILDKQMVAAALQDPDSGASCPNCGAAIGKFSARR